MGQGLKMIKSNSLNETSIIGDLKISKSHSLMLPESKVQATNSLVFRREDVVKQHRAELASQRQLEIDQLIKYIKEEDPETCINILFVLSQSRSEEGPGGTKRQRQKQFQSNDELCELMDRLDIRKDFLVGCMRSVLYETLTEFFFSIGKSKHHIRQFESSSSE